MQIVQIVFVPGNDYDPPQLLAVTHDGRLFATVYENFPIKWEMIEAPTEPDRR